MHTIRKAVIPAAGLGTRFLPATKAVPKEMLPLVDKPTIQYIVEEAEASGLEDVLFITGRGKSAIEDHFDQDPGLEHTLRKRGKIDQLDLISRIARMVSVSSIRQNEPLGLGHAILMAELFVGRDPFAVFLGDDVIQSDVPAMQQMLEMNTRFPGIFVAVQEVPEATVSRFGIVAGEVVEGTEGRLLRVDRMVEKPEPEAAPSNLAIVGRYLLTPEIFSSLHSVTPGAGGEIQLTDGIVSLMKAGLPIFAYRFKGTYYDAGDKLGNLKATIEVALRHEEIGPAFHEYLQELMVTLKE